MVTGSDTTAKAGKRGEPAQALLSEGGSVERFLPFSAAAVAGSIVIAQAFAFHLSGIVTVSEYVGFRTRGERPGLGPVAIEVLIPLAAVVVSLALAGRFVLKRRKLLGALALLVPLARLPLAGAGLASGVLVTAGAPLRTTDTVMFVVGIAGTFATLYLYHWALVRAAGEGKLGWPGVFALCAGLLVAGVLKSALLITTSSQLMALADRRTEVARADGERFPYADGEHLVYEVESAGGPAAPTQRWEVSVTESQDGGKKLLWNVYVAEGVLYSSESVLSKEGLLLSRLALRGRPSDDPEAQPAPETVVTFQDGHAEITTTSGEETTSRRIQVPEGVVWWQDVFVHCAALPLEDGYEARIPVFFPAGRVGCWRLNVARGEAPPWVPGAAGGNGEAGENGFLIAAFTYDLFRLPFYAYYDVRTGRPTAIDLGSARVTLREVTTAQDAKQFSLE